MQIHDDIPEDYTLTADYCDDCWTVVDASNQRWWPDAEAKLEIDAAADPEATALAICETGPWRGEWIS